jgi:glycosyltransferase involved in cell wall biosynthesis
MLPLVSILIPAYNADRWIADAIQSALNQTWQRKEIIIIDDGSVDQTASVASQFASRGVTVVVQNNQGAASARNHAFSICRGDLIQWLDADDLLAPDKIEKQVSILNNSSSKRTLISSEWARFTYRPKKAHFIPSVLWCDLPPAEWLIRKLQHNLFMQTATWLVSRELSVAAGEWDVRMLSDDDGEYFCRVIRASECVRFCPGSKVFYRNTPTYRLSHIGMSESKKEAMVLSMKLHVQHLRSLNDSDRSRAACVTYLQNWLIYFYPERPDLVRDLQSVAFALGGRLVVPELRWKYSWMIPLFGWSFAKNAQMTFPLWKQLSNCRIERWFSVLDKRDRFEVPG